MSEKPTPETDALDAGIVYCVPMTDHARRMERQRDELAAALRHMQWCQSCADGSWEDCCDGRDALALLARLREGGEG